MARPKISNAPKQKRKYTRRTPVVTEQTLGEKIIEQMVLLNRTLTLATQFINVPAKTPDEVTVKLAHTEPVILPLNVEQVPAPKKRGRRSNAEIAAAKAAETGPAFVASEFPKACACGVREDLPPHLHSKACPVHGDGTLELAEHQKPPAEVVALTMDDIRGVAIAYAGKHGKEKLSEILASFGCEMLSRLKEEDRPKLMGKLQAGL